MYISHSGPNIFALRMSSISIGKFHGCISYNWPYGEVWNFHRSISIVQRHAGSLLLHLMLNCKTVFPKWRHVISNNYKL